MEGIKDDGKIFEYYSNLIQEYASKKKPHTTIVQKNIDGHHYYILFTSTGGTGDPPKFFRIVEDFNKRIKNLSGSQIMSYLRHYVENSGVSLLDY